MTATPSLGLPQLAPAQALKHVTHNEALAMLDMLVQAVVLAMVNILPPDPSPGDAYLVAPDADGDLAMKRDYIVQFDAGGWRGAMPRAGWRVWSMEAGATLMHDGNGWSAETSPERLDRLGVNTEPNAQSRLAVRGASTLLDHEGAGHRLTINKQAPSDTASLVFQTSYGGRAEMGLTGSDDFEVKVSADGQSWQTAMRVSGADGSLSAGGIDLSLPTGLDIHPVINGTVSAPSNRQFDLALVEIPDASPSADIHTVAPGITGQQMVFRSASSAVSLTFLDHVGNLRLAGDCTLSKTDDILHLLAIGTSWYELSRSDNR